ncbi:hypothetical protein Mp_6g18830 [Marchantia polymorpha subsp. ruderalis]|uniref:Uncharacterized protein n=2 Tax=Marchantia polymorpha TaxID=3197 RepID=A0AAF6BTK3_MARPO|nr:hypothetical protein MARPO_0038s0093 [Marchantia polymorpha]BBN15337.1 hypothetical protein Mp_6g18830 [Marchantia polymorpha subsp. ruderalis]|eukprot:PTQ40770.1 hypothetical protein MARPO_0038s0093 [Marchantia polymorpha]
MGRGRIETVEPEQTVLRTAAMACFCASAGGNGLVEAGPAIAGRVCEAVHCLAEESTSRKGCGRVGVSSKTGAVLYYPASKTGLPALSAVEN